MGFERIVEICGKIKCPTCKTGTWATRPAIDALIAAIALEHRASMFTLDRDFSRIARMTGLSLYELKLEK